MGEKPACLFLFGRRISVFIAGSIGQGKREKNGGLGDLDSWDPGHKEIHSARDEIPLMQAYFDKMIGSGFQQIAGNRELPVTFFAILDF